jgi:hypothetical protein
MKTVVPSKHSNAWFVPNVKSGEALVSLIYRENLKAQILRTTFLCLLGALSKPYNFFFYNSMLKVKCSHYFFTELQFHFNKLIGWILKKY